jgi:hypothetical protein
VITAQADGEPSCFARVEDVDPLIAPDITLHRVWGWDAAPVVPVERVEDYRTELFTPPPGGVRVVIAEFPAPGTVPAALGPDETSSFTEAFEADAGVQEMDETSGMHVTDSIEVGIVLSGTVTLVQGNDDAVVLVPGDVVVQNGTRHAWRDVGEDGCRIAFVAMGAERRPGASAGT